MGKFSKKQTAQCPFCPASFKHRDLLEARKARFAHVIKAHGPQKEKED